MPDYVYVGGTILAVMAVGACLGWVLVSIAAVRKGPGGDAGARLRPRRLLWASCAVLAAVVAAIAYGFLAYWLPWDRARTLQARVDFVRETFVEKLSSAPGEVTLRPSGGARPGESDVYVGTAVAGGDTWDVRVWNAGGELRMEASRREAGPWP